MEHKVPSQEALTIRPARPEDAPMLARLMSEAISWGRLGELGEGFVTLVHRHMIDSRYAICFVAERDGEILGYSAWGTDTTRFYREFISRHGLRAAVTLLPRVFRPRQLKVIIRGLTYFPEGHPEDPRAEILSFAVRPQTKQSGIGKAIFKTMIDDFRARGISSIKVGTVEATNEAGNRFYRRLGFELIRTIPFYKESQVNVYVYRIA